MFGGQLLGQFVRAASLTCPDKAVKSLHAVFAREGRAAEPVRYRTTRQHEGRSFASLTITAHQPHAVLASAAVSMHASEEGPEHQDCEPIPALLSDAHRVELDLIPWETRSADDLTAAATAAPRFEFWMRTPGGRRGARAGTDRLRHRPHPHRHCAAPVRGVQPPRQRNTVHLRRHIPHRVVSPAVPHRPVAVAATAQSSAGTRSMLRARRRPRARRHVGRVVCARGAGALPRSQSDGRRMRQKCSHIARVGHSEKAILSCEECKVAKTSSSLTLVGA